MNEIGIAKEELDTPALWVDLDTLERNIATLIAHFQEAGVNWRPHTKGIKTPAIAHKAINAGAIGVTCAKLGEAEVMAAAGIRDILVANQVVGARKITRLVHLQRQASVKVALDNAEVAAEMGALAAAQGVEVPVLIEVNTGMNRAGTEPGQPTVELAQRVADIPGLHFAGLMTWEGHTLAHQDPEIKRQEIEKALDLLQETVVQCQDAGLPLEIISGGGSGTLAVTPFLNVLTEVQAGGAIFTDVTYRGYWDGTRPSLFVRTTVTSRPTPERIIIDAGYKTLPTWHRTPEPVDLPDLPAIDQYRTSAEHGILWLTAPDVTVNVGDALDILVGYGDATVFLHDQIYGIRNGVVEAIWPITARGKLR